MAAKGGSTGLGEVDLPSFEFLFEAAEGGLSCRDTGLDESRLDGGEWRTWDGREKDCSNGLGSRSKSDLVCLARGGCGLTSGELDVSPFLGGVTDMMTRFRWSIKFFYRILPI